MTQPTSSPPTLTHAPTNLSHPKALLLILLLATPLLLVHLGTGSPVDMMELFNLIPVREAYRDGHWLMPTLNGTPRLEKPPLPVWIPAAFASLFHSDNLWILRLPSLLAALLASVATYAIGATLFKNPSAPRHSEKKFALLAALFLPAMLTFNRQSRLATYDIYASAFLTCALYFLLLLAERGKSPDERAPRGIAWFAIALLAGIATGLSILSKGPVPVATVMIPFGLWLLAFHRRASVWVGVLLAALVSLLTFMPWLIAIGGLPGIIEPREPAAWRVWSAELIQFGTGQAANTTAGSKADLTDPPYYYLQMFIWVVPLTPTFIAALLLPFVKSQSDPQPSDRQRRGNWLLFLILIVGLLMLTVPSEKKPRYALQLFPYCALLCAALWQEVAWFPRDKKIDAGAGTLFSAQALFFIVPAIAGILATLYVAVTYSFFKWPFVSDALHANGIFLPLLLFTALAASGILSWHRLYRYQFHRALVPFAAASVLFFFTFEAIYKTVPSTHTNPARAPAEAALAAAGKAPVVTIAEYRPWLPTLFFSNQILPPLTTQEFIAFANRYPQVHIYLLLVTARHDAKSSTDTPMPLLKETFATIEQQTHRPLQEHSHWLDENRVTTLYHLPTTSPVSTAPATTEKSPVTPPPSTTPAH